jgi:hypothetical protein
MRKPLDFTQKNPNLTRKKGLRHGEEKSLAQG